MMKEEAKVELKKGALTTVVEYAMHFWRSIFFLIREKHLGIDIFGINFASMRGNNIVDLNDGSAAISVGEVEEEGDDSKDVKKWKMFLVSIFFSTDPTKDLFSTEVIAPLLLIWMIYPFPLLNDDAPQGDEIFVNIV